MISQMLCLGHVSLGFWLPGGTSNNGIFLRMGIVLLSCTFVSSSHQAGARRRILPCSRRVLCHYNGSPKPRQPSCQQWITLTCSLQRSRFQSRLPPFYTAPSFWRSVSTGIWVSIGGFPGFRFFSLFFPFFSYFFFRFLVWGPPSFPPLSRGSTNRGGGWRGGGGKFEPVYTRSLSQSIHVCETQHVCETHFCTETCQTRRESSLAGVTCKPGYHRTHRRSRLAMVPACKV